MSTFGAEIEKPISLRKNQKSYGISQKFFRRVASKYEGSALQYSDIQPETIIGTDIPSVGHIGVDNAFNLQETSSEVCQNLEELHSLLQTDLSVVSKTLAEEGATVINMSIHPMGKTTPEFYRAMVAPKGVYAYIAQRGWDHTAGIDAKAQNSPATGVLPEDAAKAVTTVIGAGAATFGIFANSPFAEGRLTKYKEARAMMWNRFMRNSISEGDRTTARFPEQPFESLRDYFSWMFGEGTNIHFVVLSNAGYKTFGDAAVLIDGNPSVLEYLSLAEAKGTRFSTQEPIVITPDISHMEAMQFAQFTGARIRWHFNTNCITKEEFLDAFDKDELEALFSGNGVAYTYIEGRDPGANFPDAFLANTSSEIAESVVISPSAVQAGLLNNLDAAHRYIRSFPWQQLHALRNAAIRDGLEGQVGGITVRSFAENILNLAEDGLSYQEKRFLSYPRFVLETNTNGADRAIEDFRNGKDISEIVKSRHVII